MSICSMNKSASSSAVKSIDWPVCCIGQKDFYANIKVSRKTLTEHPEVPERAINRSKNKCNRSRMCQKRAPAVAGNSE